ncbi:hypothetical protein P8452_54488 [Trifolium repens]|nr:hypothetical protein P8452_54488 [Trifolium repens]
MRGSNKLSFWLTNEQLSRHVLHLSEPLCVKTRICMEKHDVTHSNDLSHLIKAQEHLDFGLLRDWKKKTTNDGTNK